MVMRQEYGKAKRNSLIGPGATISVRDRAIGAVWQAALFGAALELVTYTLAEAMDDRQMDSCLRAQMHSLVRWDGHTLCMCDSPPLGRNRNRLVLHPVPPSDRCVLKLRL